MTMARSPGHPRTGNEVGVGKVGSLEGKGTA